MEQAKVTGPLFMQLTLGPFSPNIVCLHSQLMAALLSWCRVPFERKALCHVAQKVVGFADQICMHRVQGATF